MHAFPEIRRLLPGLMAGFACLIMPLANADNTAAIDDCNSCHGPDGVSAESDVPTIAGVSPFVLEEYMFEYRDDARPCRESKYRSGDMVRPATDMCAIAQELDDANRLDFPALMEYPRDCLIDQTVSGKTEIAFRNQRAHG